MKGHATESAAGTVAETRPDENHVPGWMALLVMLLAIGVLGVGALVVKRVVEDRAASDPSAVAIERYSAAVRADPASNGARLNLAYAYQQASRYDEAIVQYDRVLSVDPKNLAALYNKGMIAAARGDRTAAARWWSEVLGVDPTHVLAAKALGEQLASTGSYRALVGVVRPAAEANPQFADLDYLLGLAYENTGNRVGALERYRLALRYSPEMSEARAGLERLGGDAP